MSAVFTKESTVCYYGLQDSNHLPEFIKRRVRTVNGFSQKIFNSEDRYKEDEVMQALLETQKRLEREKKGGKEEVTSIISKEKLCRRDHINKKRAFIKRCLQAQIKLNLAEVAKFTRCSFDTVKRVHRELFTQGEVSTYQYNNLKSKEDQEALDKSIERIQEGFMTVSDLKRCHPMFSRKKILAKMHEKGYRYRLLPKDRKKPPSNTINSTRVCRVISHISQCICDTNSTILYCDEIKFPLYQTSEKRWMHGSSTLNEAIVYNRRPAVQTTLTAIALCSLQKFEAIQLFTKEVTGADFLYFLNEAISQLPSNKHYSIITDNATWHHAVVVSSTKASRFLYFNEPRMFQLNVIENAFSFVRFEFRKRPIVDTIEEEAKRIVEIFFSSDNPKRFEGLFRNHLRMLITFLEKHKPK